MATLLVYLKTLALLADLRHEDPFMCHARFPDFILATFEGVITHGLIGSL